MTVETKSNDLPPVRDVDVSGAGDQDPWMILGYELVEGSAASEEDVLGQQNVQDALSDGLRELREIRAQRDATT